MKRQIKFRAYDTEENKYFEPTYEAYKGNLEDLSVTFSGELCRRTLQFPSEHESCFKGRYILEQWIGLKDKNEVEIYEGDIIEIKHPYKNRCYQGEIIYIDARFTGKDFYFTHHDNPSDIWESLEYVEIIGNIHTK